jgi:hypothetical protein
MLLGILLVLAALAGLGAAIDAGLVAPGRETPSAPTQITHGRHGAHHHGAVLLDPHNNTLPVVRHQEEPTPAWLLLDV